MLPDSAIYRQFRDFGGLAGDKIFAKIARDFHEISRDFEILPIFGDFPAISRKILAISAIFEPCLAFQKSQNLHIFQSFKLKFFENFSWKSSQKFLQISIF